MAGYTALSSKTLAQLQSFGLGPDQLSIANEKAKDEIGAEQRKLSLNQYGRVSSNRKEICLLLLGKTGAGKSATANMIIGGKKQFTESMHSVSCTATIKLAERNIDGTTIKVIDTPGFNDTNASAEEVITEIIKVIDHYRDGIDGVLFVFNLGDPRYTTEQKEAFQSIEQGALGAGFISNCFIVFTHGNELLKHGGSLQEYLATEVRERTEFGELLNRTVSKRVIAIDNDEDTSTEYKSQHQRERLVRMIASSAPTRCTPDAFKAFAQKQRESTSASVPMNYQHRLPELERYAADALISIPRAQMIGMSERDKQDIISGVVTRMAEKDQQTYTAVGAVVKATMDNYTDKSGSDGVDSLAKTLLTAAGQGIKKLWRGLKKWF